MEDKIADKLASMIREKGEKKGYREHIKGGCNFYFCSC